MFSEKFLPQKYAITTITFNSYNIYIYIYIYIYINWKPFELCVCVLLKQKY